MSNYTPKILMVDDQKDLLMVMERMLEPLGVELVKAYSGEEAVNLTLQNNFALCILDVVMPNMDGFEAAELILNNKKTSHLPIIFVTAMDESNANILQGYDIGAVDFLHKPVQQSILVSKVKTFLLIDSRQRQVQKSEEQAQKLLLQNQKNLKKLQESQEKLLQLMREKDNARVDAEQLNVILQYQAEQAQKLADEAKLASIEKSNFLANMSHEIRTPLNGVIGMNGLLLDTELDDAQRFYAETINKSGQSLLDLINDILDFSKIEAGKLELEIIDFNLRSLLDDFSDIMSHRVHEKKLEFICAAAPETPIFLKGDPGRLRQVLINLTGNAIKFTDSGEVVVRASLLAEDGDDIVVRFSIKDTGIGIPSDKQERLFEQFTQVDSSVTRKFGGTGLGLAISKQLTTIMGGEIGVFSEEGEGSEFWFTSRFIKQSKPDIKQIPNTSLDSARILIVDDNATNRAILSSQIKYWGALTDEAPEGKIALKMLKKAAKDGKPYHAALIDMDMPDMEGESLGKAIKADKEIKDTRMIVMPSIGQRGDAQRFEEVGFAAYLMKPVRQTDLQDCIAVVLADKKWETKQTIITRHSLREMRRENYHVLLADDNITNQQVVLNILKKLGLNADAVANGQEAVEALEMISYDLVLMDCQMPEMDGYEASSLIRAPDSKVKNHEVPIIALTANAMQGDREKCLNAGMNDYLSKPIDKDQLIELLEKWLPDNSVTNIKAMEGTKENKNSNSKTKGSKKRNKSSIIFESALLIKNFDNDIEIIKKVLNKYLTDANKHLKELIHFYQIKDIPQISSQAHKMKGAAAAVGANAFACLLEEIEISSLQEEIEKIDTEIPKINSAFKEFESAVNQFYSG